MLSAFQDLLVGLVTDASLRSRFARDRAEVLADAQLDREERAALEGLSAEELERYARSLVSKRWEEVARVVPLARKIAPSLERRYRAWCAWHPAEAKDTVLSPGAAEAERALAALRAELARDEGEAAYAADVLAFEVLAASSRGDGRARAMTSAYAIPDLVAELRRGVVPMDPERAPTEVRFEGPTMKWRRRA